MRGRSCTQPFLVEGGACRPAAFLLLPRWVSRSPPHPTRLRRPTFPPRGRLWVEKNPASQTSGPRKGRNKIQSVFCTDTRRAKNSAHPESASFAGAVRGASPNFGSPAQRVPKFLPFPARPAGGRAVTGLRKIGRRPGKKRRRTSPGSSKPEQGVQRGETLPSGPLSPVSREKRGPPPGRRPTGRCAPRLRKSPDHPKGTQYRPPPPRRGLFLPKSLDKGSLIG